MFRELFYMHKSDRRVILTLLVVMAVAIAVLLLAGGKEAPIAQQDLKTLNHQSPQNTQNAQTIQNTQSPQPTMARSLFRFDPNSADSSQLLRLGLPQSIIHNIYKYRAAGGIFRKKEDFARLYGLTVGQYRELEPYITISADYQPAATLFQKDHQNPPTPNIPEKPERPEFPENPGNPGNPEFPVSPPSYPHKLSPGETIDIATADTTSLKQIPGIGPYYARRIVEYGHRLGGFVSLDQLNEIDNFPQEAKQYMTLSLVPVTRLNINKLSLNELRHHPYINYYQARAIVDYRRQHGTINDLHDLHLLPDFPEEAINRLLPYIEY